MDTTRPPSCDVVGPDGLRLTVHPYAATDRVGDLVQALAPGGTETLFVDGRPVEGRRLLTASGMQRGSALSIARAAGPADPRDDVGATMECAVVTGPACDRWRALPPGHHIVGRAPAAEIRVEDPDVELHSGRLDVNTDRSLTFVQLTGRTPVRVESRRLAGTVDHPRGDLRLPPGSRLVIGRSAVAFRPLTDARAGGGPVNRHDGGSTSACASDPWRRVVRRAPPVPEEAGPPPVVVPSPPDGHRVPPAMGLIGAGVAACGAGLMAIVLGQSLFALFALVGAVGSVATWAAGATMAVRARRRATAHYMAALEDFGTALGLRRDELERRHLADHPSVVDALHLVHDEPGRLWSRRPGAGEPVRATIGRGDVRYPLAIGDDERRSLPPERMTQIGTGEVVADVPAPIALGPGSTIALHGDVALAASMARAIAVQVAALYGPADVRLVVVTRRPDHWAWIDWLPHGGHCIDIDSPTHADELRELAADADPSGATVVITDAADLLVARTGATRRMLVATRASCLVITPGDQSVPAVCDRVLHVGSTGRLQWHGGDGSEAGAYESSTAQVAGITIATATAAARRLAPLIDPEAEDQMTGLPSGVGLADIGSLASSTEILRRWREGGIDPALAVTIGVTGDGTVELDLVRDGPHALIAGTTGAGKSELLRTLIVGLAARVGPDHVTFVLVDYKGGSTFDSCARLPHVVGVVSDLDEGLAERALVSLDAEITRREQLLRSVGADDLARYRRASTTPLPRLVVVIDEFAGLARELPDFLAALVAIAQRGRSLGVHLILATQRPAGVVNDDIRANTNLRLALRVQDVGDARDVIGDDAPAGFARSVPGRAALRLGADDMVVFQAASCTGPLRPRPSRLWIEPYRPRVPASRDGGDGDAPTELGSMVAAIADAALAGAVELPHRPWIDPLPAAITADLDHEVGDGVGLVDDPQRQRRFPLAWDAASGNLLLVGSLGSGTTTTAVAAAAALMRSSAPSDLHLYVVDGRGDRAWEPVAASDHCGALVAAHETERLVRLLRRLAAEIDARAGCGTSTPRIVLVVDGLGPVRTTLAATDAPEWTALLDRVIADGPAVGIVTCATTDGSSSSTLATPAVHRWVLHVDDPTVARAAGLSGRVPSGDVPGRLRIVETDLEAQVRSDPRLPDHASCAAAERGAPPVDVLPVHVDPAEFDRSGPAYTAARDGSALLLAVGIGADDLGVAHLRVPAGDHVFVGGAAGTGTSTALRQLTAAWRAAHPDGVVVALDPATAGGSTRLAEARTGHAGRPLLVAVDDADRVDDTDGMLAGLASGRDTSVTMIAAARLESARVAYGHWVRALTRSRCGLIMTSAAEVDGDLLGAVLPRRTMIPARPGLAWAIDGTGQRLVQVAARMQS